MLHTTRGIVLRTIRYNDKAVIANIYTELFGLQGYLIHTGKNKKKRIAAAAHLS
jgi:DNA repair protein RecO (recombination protein O)